MGKKLRSSGALMAQTTLKFSARPWNIETNAQETQWRCLVLETLGKYFEYPFF